MLFKNKIEYTKGMFVEIYGTEIKKVRLVLRIITGIAVVAAIAFMIYGAAARGFIMPGDFFNLGISILMALLCTFLPNLMARSQMKKCKKRGLLGERTLRFTEHVLTMTYEKEGRSTDIPLEELTKVTEFDNFIRITIGGRSTFLDKKRFEIGDAAAFVAWAEYTGECDYDAFDDAYCGEAESEEDFAYGFVEDHGLLNEVPESLRVYFDYEAYARDLFSSGYVFHEGYVFSN